MARSLSLAGAARASSAVITVGDGRGFVIGEYVITAAHCLPWFPPCLSISYPEERTYPNLLALLGKKPACVGGVSIC
jgi:hypothetical protein